MDIYDCKESDFGKYIVISRDGKITDLYFSEKEPKLERKAIDVTKHPVLLQGTEFQKTVWNKLMSIRKGETVTYAELAKRVGKPKAVRAVASAVAKNRIAILVPCHRVVPSVGGVGKYRWGSERKKRILDSENKR